VKEGKDKGEKTHLSTLEDSNEASFRNGKKLWGEKGESGEKKEAVKAPKEGQGNNYHRLDTLEKGGGKLKQTKKNRVAQGERVSKKKTIRIWMRKS